MKKLTKGSATKPPGGKRGKSSSSLRVAASPRRPVESSRPGMEKYERVFEQIYKLVLRIPAGRVMTYGQIARLLDDRYSPRLVGWAMHATPQDGRDIPWHRVINSRGATSTGKIILHEPDLQRLLLESEGILFNDKGCCDLSLYQWSPPKRAKRALPTNAKESPFKKSRAKSSASADRNSPKPKSRKIS